MPKKAPAKVKKTSKANSPVRYQVIREQIENMKELHAVALVIMVSLVAVMFMTVARQKIAIESLRFQVSLLQERYEIQRDRNMDVLEEKINAENGTPAVKQ
jgi:hypothetical protein